MNGVQERICRVYAARGNKFFLYDWHRPEIRHQKGEKDAVIASLLASSYGTNLSEADVLDVGCGSGGFLRTLVEWGAQPSRLFGTEFLEDRLQTARNCSPSDIKYHLGDLSNFLPERFDLVTSHTVFSSILDENERKELAHDMWRVLKPGGWLLIYDFRYNNPTNNDVRKVTRNELLLFWKEGVQRQYRTLHLAPPLARKIIPLTPLLGSLLPQLFPFLRSHFCFLLKKPLSE